MKNTQTYTGVVTHITDYDKDKKKRIVHIAEKGDNEKCFQFRGAFMLAKIARLQPGDEVSIEAISKTCKDYHITNLIAKGIYQLVTN